MNVCFGLGSNLGDRLGNLRDACDRLRTLGRITRASDVYETPAWGGVAQPDFLNACVMLEMFDESLSPRELLSRIKSFESELGRVESVHWGPRRIDIDILLIDDVVYHSLELNVPHVSMGARMFVLIPLEQIVPEGWKHPETGRTVREMIEALEAEQRDSRSGIRVFPSSL